MHDFANRGYAYMKSLMYVLGITIFFITTVHAKVADSLQATLQEIIIANHKKQIAALRAQTAEEKAREAQLLEQNRQFTADKERLTDQAQQLEEENRRLKAEQETLKSGLRSQPLCPLAPPSRHKRSINWTQPKSTQPDWLWYKMENF